MRKHQELGGTARDRLSAMAAIAAAASSLNEEENARAWSSIDVGLERQGKKIILPDDPTPMAIPTAIAQLQRIAEDEAREYQVVEFIPGAPWDAGLAFYKAMQATYGVVSTMGVGWNMPELKTIRTGPGPKDVVQMPIGEFNIPSIRNPLYGRPYIVDGVPGFQVASTCCKAEQAFLIELCNVAKEILRLESIYRGRAIRVFMDGDHSLDMAKEPAFMDLASVRESDLVFNAATSRLIETNLFTPMRNTATCRNAGIPLKRAVLLEGPYGCGKSLTSTVAAKVATDNDWTYIVIDDVRSLKSAIEFAKLYQPAMIFAEDIDRMGDRSNESVNNLINMMSGILTHGSEIMIVLTTNYIEKIDQAYLRPGRLDAVIRIDAPDAEAVEKLFRYYGGELLEAEADLTQAAQELEGQIPATIREVVERSKLAMIMERRTHISADDLYVTAVGMRRHLELLAPKKKDDSAAEKLAAGLKGVLGGGDLEVDPATGKLLGVIVQQGEKNLDLLKHNHEHVIRAEKAATSAAAHAKNGRDKTVAVEQRVKVVQDVVENI